MLYCSVPTRPIQTMLILSGSLSLPLSRDSISSILDIHLANLAKISPKNIHSNNLVSNMYKIHTAINHVAHSPLWEYVPYPIIVPVSTENRNASFMFCTLRKHFCSVSAYTIAVTIDANKVQLHKIKITYSKITLAVLVTLLHIATAHVLTTSYGIIFWMVNLRKRVYKYHIPPWVGVLYSNNTERCACL